MENKRLKFYFLKCSRRYVNVSRQLMSRCVSSQTKGNEQCNIIKQALHLPYSVCINNPYKTLQHYIRIMLQKVVRDDDVDTVICFHHTMYFCSILTNDAQLNTPCDFTFAANNESIWIEVSQDTRLECDIFTDKMLDTKTTRTV